jgi:hypothetical protein
MRIRQTVPSLVALVTACAGCASMPARVGATPTVEVAAGFNLAQLPQAQFPGLTGSIAIIVPKAPTWGAALVADVESSYLIHSRTAGARVYHRSGPLFSERRTVSYFGQLLAGTATGSEEGVLRSEGGLIVEPSVGLDYGAGARAFHLRVGYRNVRNGTVYDSRVPGGPTDRLSGERITVGMTWRFRSR